MRGAVLSLPLISPALSTVAVAQDWIGMSPADYATANRTYTASVIDSNVLGSTMGGNKTGTTSKGGTNTSRSAAGTSSLA